ncbi:hypothetical protein Syun_011805 [Stephania yunnanensis]|uniref:S5 DRBM domain-containing protein n=1 Tax=Stephania yunnanensis TaxID=152371 RepID=A0AAP0PIF7_9MAGN
MCFLGWTYTAIMACGNYHGVVGYAKGKGPAVPIALQKAYEKCFQNLHYVERYEEHTIAHAVQTQYEKTKIYLWPAPTQTGMKAGKTVQTILNLVGLKNVKSKFDFALLASLTSTSVAQFEDSFTVHAQASDGAPEGSSIVGDLLDCLNE